MFKSILVPIDGSEASFAALQNAAELARLAQAELRGLFVEDQGKLMPPVWAQPPADGLLPTAGLAPSVLTLSQEVLKEWEETGKLIQEAFAEHCRAQGVKGTLSILRGEDTLIMVEQARRCGLVVMGRRSRLMIGSAPGSHAEALLLKTTRPVMVVPAGGKRTARVLIAYDSSPAAQRALEYGADFATLQFSTVDVLTVGESPQRTQAAQEEARQFLGPYQLDACFVVKAGEPAATITGHAERIGAGLVVMGAYGHSRLRELLFGCTTRDVLKITKCPVLLAA